MFAIKGSYFLNRKRRQVTEPSLDFIFPDPPQPFSVENLNYTDEQREFCNNITECMFDLLFTGDTEIARNTMDVRVEGTRQRIEISKENEKYLDDKNLFCFCTVFLNLGGDMHLLLQTCLKDLPQMEMKTLLML